MLGLVPDKSTDSPLSVLLLGAHSDDIEIGCGGTILRLIREYPQARFTWIVLSADARRESEARASAELFLEGSADAEVFVHSFRDGYFPGQGADIKDVFEEYKKRLSPDLVFTHFRHDAHQDHRLLCELTWNTWRHHAVLEYEVPKYDGDLGHPNVYLHLSGRTARRKTELLMKCFQTQQNKDWFTEDTFLGLMRLRGMESRAPERYAEAFYGPKLVFPERS